MDSDILEREFIAAEAEKLKARSVTTKKCIRCYNEKDIAHRYRALCEGPYENMP